MTVDRRKMLGLSIAAAASPAAAANVAVAPAEVVPIWPPAEQFALWPGLPPGSPPALPRLAPEITGRAGEYHDIWMRGTARPDVGVFRPNRPDGRAVLIMPGGGYSFVSLRGEGIDVAATLTPRGITCFVLNYRLPAEGWLDRANTPLADAQRAMRLIRANAERFAIDPARLGIIGFSAGGHLAGSLATQSQASVYRPIDAADRHSARPAYAALMYAVSNMEAGRSTGGSRANLMGPVPDPAMVRRYAVDRNMTAATPPLFIAHAQDDITVPVINSIDLFAAARQVGVPAEAHFFLSGGHGFGARLPRTLPGSLWPDLLVRWISEVSRTGAAGSVRG